MTLGHSSSRKSRTPPPKNSGPIPASVDENSGPDKQDQSHLQEFALATNAEHGPQASADGTTAQASKHLGSGTTWKGCNAFNTPSGIAVAESDQPHIKNSGTQHNGIGSAPGQTSGKHSQCYNSEFSAINSEEERRRCRTLSVEHGINTLGSVLTEMRDILAPAFNEHGEANTLLTEDTVNSMLDFVFNRFKDHLCPPSEPEDENAKDLLQALGVAPLSPEIETESNPEEITNALDFLIDHETADYPQTSSLRLTDEDRNQRAENAAEARAALMNARGKLVFDTIRELCVNHPYKNAATALKKIIVQRRKEATDDYVRQQQGA